jgi:hypothetical protein
VQSGTPFRLTSGRQTVNGSDAGVVLMNGHTVEDIQKLLRIRSHPTTSSRYWADEKLIGADGRANPEYLAVPTTPGEWGQLITLRGMPVWAFDASLNKTTEFVGKSNITVHITSRTCSTGRYGAAPDSSASPTSQTPRSACRRIP